MPSFGTRSRAELDTLHPYLQRVLHRAITHVDFTVLKGYRGREEQNALYEADPPKTTLRWPESTHNHRATRRDVSQGYAHRPGQPLSLGVDVAPWHTTEPHIRWERTGEFYLLAGMCRGIATEVLPDGWQVRLGADWDGDGYTSDQSFHDLGHLELIRPDSDMEIAA